VFTTSFPAACQFQGEGGTISTKPFADFEIMQIIMLAVVFSLVDFGLLTLH
jgi:hypothetical protein